ncbi:hypothetical protein B1A_00533, partial [mine drainage metagenome]
RVDTMTVSLFGEYEKEEDGAIKIVYGHAKSNNRPGCKQIEVGAASVGPGMPLASRVLDGNASDKTFNFEMLEDLSRQLSLEDVQRLVYVADSQMVTEANLQRVDLLGWRFISRLPNNYTLCDEVKERALALGAWQDVGRSARIRRLHPTRCRSSRKPSTTAVSPRGRPQFEPGEAKAGEHGEGCHA